MRIRRAIMGLGLLVTVAALLFFYSQRDKAQEKSPRTTQGTSQARGAYSLQDPDNPCGAVCLSMVSRLLKRPLTLAEANRLLRPDALGRTSMAELVRGLRASGFGAAGVKLPTGVSAALTSPLILYLDESHFAVAVTSGSDHVVLLDPPFPPTVTSWSNLTERWDGFAILVTPQPDDMEPVLSQLGVKPAHMETK